MQFGYLCNDKSKYNNGVGQINLTQTLAHALADYALEQGSIRSHIRPSSVFMAYNASKTGFSDDAVRLKSWYREIKFYTGLYHSPWDIHVNAFNWTGDFWI